MLEICNLTKKFKNKFSNDFSLNINHLNFDLGHINFITGESGSGKTTLLKILAGLIKNYEGNIYFQGVNYRLFKNDSISSFISYIEQIDNLFEEINIKDNLLLTFKLKNKSIPSEEQLREFLNKVNLNEEVLSMFPKELSGGMKKRISVLRSILLESKVLLIDEPTSSLDDENAFEIFNILNELSKEKLIICVTHFIEIEEKLSSFRNIEINNGKIIKDEEKRPIYNRDSIPLNNNSTYTNNPHYFKIENKKSNLKEKIKFSFVFFKKNIKKTIATLIGFTVVVSLSFSLIFLSNYHEQQYVDEIFNANTLNFLNVCKVEKPANYKFLGFTYPNYEDIEIEGFYNKFGKNVYFGCQNAYPTPVIHYFSYIDDNFINSTKSSFEFIGRLPNDTLNESIYVNKNQFKKLTFEVVITKEALIEYGLLNDNASIYDVEAMLGKKYLLREELRVGNLISIGSHYAKIVGILDTHYNELPFINNKDLSNEEEQRIDNYRIFGNHLNLYFNPVDFNNLQFFDYIKTAILVNLKGKINQLYDFLNTFNETDYYYNFVTCNEYANGIQFIERDIRYKTFFIRYLNIGLILATFFVYIFLIKSNVNENYNNIILFNSLGLKKRDAYHIFVFNFIFLFLIMLLLSLTTTILSFIFLNYHFMNKYFLPMFLFSFPFSELIIFYIIYILFTLGYSYFLIRKIQTKETNV